MQHAGRSVIVSGSTVAVGLLSMVVLPLPFIRSIGIGGMLIPAVSVLASITLLPAMLAMLGHAHQPRPRDAEAARRGQRRRERLLELVGEHRHAPRALLTAAIGVVIVAALLVPGLQLNPSEAQAKDLPGGGDAIAGPDRRSTPRASRPASTSRSRCSSRAARRQRGAATDRAAARRRPPASPAPRRRRRGAAATRRSSRRSRPPTARRATTKHTISSLQNDVLPAVAPTDGHRACRSAASQPRTRTSSTRSTATSRTSCSSSSLLTYLLLARAFRSLILPLKAVILNLVSLGAAYGIVVFIFQWGHGVAGDLERAGDATRSSRGSR